MPLRLTQFSHGAGCGCKIAPDVLERILHSSLDSPVDPRLIVGNASRDDAAVYDLGNGETVISTTDFFMPIVDDPFEFGRIAATNAISDIYAMGGQPIMAIAILGWPVNQIPAEAAREVLEGARTVCADAGISLAGGHSIDSPEPIFGLAVTGRCPLERIRRNNTASAGDLLYLTKPLGVGVITSAAKQQKAEAQDLQDAIGVMTQLNRSGMAFSNCPGVTAMTDVTGFGLLGHLREICAGSDLTAHLDFASIPCLPSTKKYIEAGCIPGGTQRNFNAYGDKVSPMTAFQQALLCDPQTSGGLLVCVTPNWRDRFEQIAISENLNLKPIGVLATIQATGYSIELR